MPNLTKAAFTIFTISLTIALNGQDIKRCGSQQPSAPAFISNSGVPHSYPRTTIYIPIVFHVVWRTEEENISDEIIWSQLDVLNEDYNGLNNDIAQVPDRFQRHIGKGDIRFCLATIDPDGNASNGIVRRQTDVDAIGGLRSADGDRMIKHAHLGGSSSWDVSSYLNVWVGDRDDFLGDSTFPQDEDVPSDEEGVVIKYSAFGIQPGSSGRFNQGRTLTHEIGHYLNVLHLFGSDTGCNNDDDLVDDTPKQSGPYFGCEDDDDLASCGSRDMASNFMNFRDDACMNFFSKGQVLRMTDALFTYRFELINSGICNSDPVLPEDPLRVARINTLTDGIEISLTTLTGQEYEILLFSTDGRKLWASDENPTNRYTFKNLPMGIYVLSLEFNGDFFGRKVFIP